jgi:spore coat protein U-like protein
MRIGVVRALVAVTAAGAVVIGVASMRATAATASADLSVSATVTTNCTINTGPLAFGNYDPVGMNATKALEATGRVTVACTKGTSPKIALGATNGKRQLKGGTGNNELLEYELYQDSNRSVVWSDTNQLTAGAAGSKNARDFNVYGRIPSGQDVGAGAYADTVVATVNF